MLCLCLFLLFFTCFKGSCLCWLLPTSTHKMNVISDILPCDVGQSDSCLWFCTHMFPIHGSRISFCLSIDLFSCMKCWCICWLIHNMDVGSIDCRFYHSAFVDGCIIRHQIEWIKCHSCPFPLVLDGWYPFGFQKRSKVQSVGATYSDIMCQYSCMSSSND